MRIAILMPAFDEGGRAVETLAELESVVSAEEGAKVDVTVFLVDDGSTPGLSASALAQVAGSMRIVFARHAVNLGQGAALETARRLALSAAYPTFDAYVTMDSDGQHRASDVLAMARALREGVDVALGDRFKGGSNVPNSRVLLLRAARLFERLTTGLSLSDAHNGLRAFRRTALVAMRVRQNRMAHATEITRRIARTGLRFVEVPVHVRYSQASLAKGQRASGAMAIVADLLLGFLFEDEKR